VNLGRLRATIRWRHPLYFRSVDRHLKERLIGAAVLIAAAVILIPEMLSGPNDKAQDNEASPAAASAPTAAADGSPVKTYTIDLNKAAAGDTKWQPEAPAASAPTTDAKPAVEISPAPPPEIADELPVVATVKPSSKPAELPTPTIATPAPKPATQTLAQKPKDPAPNYAAPKDAAKEVELAANVKASAATGKWAVQVASFGVRATSERIAKDLKSQGHPAYVAESQVKGQTMYRVRVGPVEERAAAEALLRKVKTTHPNANVVAHP